MRAFLVSGTMLLMGACTLQVPINLPGSMQQQPAADVSVPINTGSSSVPLVVCPPKVDYTKDQQLALSEAIVGLPPGSVIVGVLADYHDMRVADDLCLHPKQ